MIRWVLVFLAVLLTGCKESSERRVHSSNPDIKVERLFTTDGCTVYRFYDWNHHYFTRCRGGSVSTTGVHAESCGKNCTVR